MLGVRNPDGGHDGRQVPAGSRVAWNWGSGSASGKVSDWFTERVTRTIHGSEIMRNADEDNPAYLIEQEDGARVLKSDSELRRA